MDKRLKPFAKQNKEPQININPERKKFQILCAELADRGALEQLRAAAGEIVQAYRISPPHEWGGLIPYYTYSILRDGIDQLFQALYIAAEQGKRYRSE